MWVNVILNNIFASLNIQKIMKYSSYIFEKHNKNIYLNVVLQIIWGTELLEVLKE